MGDDVESLRSQLAVTTAAHSDCQRELMRVRLELANALNDFRRVEALTLSKHAQRLAQPPPPASPTEADLLAENAALRDRIEAMRAEVAEFKETTRIEVEKIRQGARSRAGGNR